MRTGAEYRKALHDGRRVWVLGDGLVEDVTSHPATRAVVDEYAAWYDLHVSIEKAMPDEVGETWPQFVPLHSPPLAEATP